MKKIILFFSMFLMVGLTACSNLSNNTQDITNDVISTADDTSNCENSNEDDINITDGDSENDDSKDEVSTVKINVKVNNQTLHATLYDNATTRDIVSQLPLTLNMMDLYGREMCYRFPNELDHDDIQYRGYEVGEIVYWNPGHSLVFMYEQNGEEFSMQSVGKFDEDISLFKTTGDTQVTIELAK